jgi:5-methylcytosine-specific restriction endonuclease McrA
MQAIGRLCERCGELHREGSKHRCADGSVSALVQRSAVYADPRWQRTRREVIERDRGLCRRCGERGRVVDHVLGIAAILALGRSPFDSRHCQLLCHRCSGRKDGPRRLG